MGENGITITDNRKKGWFWIENALLEREDLNCYEKLIYVTLARYCNSEGKCYPSIETLMKATSINSRGTILKYLKSLEEKELIFVARSFGKGNRYQLKNIKNNSDKQSMCCTGSTDRPVQEMNNTSTSDEQVPVHEVDSKETQLRKPNEGNLKEKYKKEVSNPTGTNSKKRNRVEEIKDYINSLDKDDEYKNLLFEFVEHRKNINAPLKTEQPIKRLVKDFPFCSDLKEAVELAKEKEWQGVYPEWVINHKNSLKIKSPYANKRGIDEEEKAQRLKNLREKWLNDSTTPREIKDVEEVF